jgi:glycosyltransferase involved in cell wall biosynthesis
MRVTFVLPSLAIAGGVRVVAIYAERLCKRGHDVHIVSGCTIRKPTLTDRVKHLFRPPPPTPAFLLQSFDIDERVHVTSIDRPGPILDAHVPDSDVIIATWWETAEWVSRLSPSKGARVYFLQHWETWAPLPVDRVEATWRLPMHKITIAQWLVDIARNRFHDPDVTLIENSVDTAQFFAPPRSKQPRPTVGIMCTHGHVKGWDIAVPTLHMLRASFPDLRIVSFGGAPPPEGLPFPPGAEFHLCPPQRSLRDLYSSIDVWICASRAEGFHLPPLEAMACRTPVVSARVGGAVETVEEGVNGFLVDIENPRALADAAAKVLRLDDAQWKAMSDAAYRRALRYSWDDATALFEAALHHAVDRARRGEIAGTPLSDGEFASTAHRV